MTGRTVSAWVLVAGYGACCTWSYWNSTYATVTFAILSLVAAKFLLDAVAERLLGGAVISAILVAVAIFVPFGFVLGALWAVVSMFTKWHGFVMRLPFLFTSMAVYTPLWYLDRLRSGAGSGLLAAALGLGGALLLLAIMQVCRMSGVDASTALFHTVGYAWYLLFFLIALAIPGGEDESAGDQVEWGGDHA
ncbi:hypothetical protein Cs7R123_49050 [Catellatospora sp. TT07R-123]|nr:hypothetical protein Cs7R123_49050 [Catellatospora sp. TT07R-123]